VVAATVIINHDWPLPDSLRAVNDSKKLTTKKREALFEIIKTSVPNYGIAIVDHQTIDHINILQASLEAMYQATLAAGAKSDCLLIDGNQLLPNYKHRQQTLVGGDGLSFTIAAASILAKVTRDRLMEEYGKLYPEYGFAKHKGYGTAAHLAAIKKYGPSPIHRLSFAPMKNKK